MISLHVVLAIGFIATRVAAVHEQTSVRNGGPRDQCTETHNTIVNNVSKPCEGDPRLLNAEKEVTALAIVKIDDDHRATRVEFKVAVGKSEWIMHDVKERNDKLDEVYLRRGNDTTCVLVTNGNEHEFVMVVHRHSWKYHPKCPTCEGVPDSTVYDSWIFVTEKSTSVVCPEGKRSSKSEH
eukprot:m.152019 g.152019  ORF g.152019 m.152019 type:complete len:181 (+) comp17880_c0_seq1:109-651(+)